MDIAVQSRPQFAIAFISAAQSEKRDGILLRRT